MGAKGKYNLERHQKIVALIQQGNYLKIAALAIGIDESTFTRWMQRGEKESKEYEEMVDEGLIQSGSEVEGHKFRQFYEDVQRARAIAEARNVKIIQDAAKETWQAAAWWLERTDPTRWGRRERIQHGVDQDSSTNAPRVFDSVTAFLEAHGGDRRHLIPPEKPKGEEMGAGDNGHHEKNPENEAVKRGMVLQEIGQRSH